MSRVARVAVLALVFVLCLPFLVACGSRLDHGTVVGKHFEPAHTWQDTEPTYVVVPVTRSSTSCSGKPSVCRTSTYVTTELRLVGFHPVTRYAPDRWTLDLQDGDEKGTIEVSQAAYNEVRIGDYWKAKP